MDPVAATLCQYVPAVFRRLGNLLMFPELLGAEVAARDDDDRQVFRKRVAGDFRSDRRQGLEMLRHTAEAAWTTPVRLHDGPQFRRKLADLTDQPFRNRSSLAAAHRREQFRKKSPASRQKSE